MNTFMHKYKKHKYIKILLFTIPLMLFLAAANVHEPHQIDDLFFKGSYDEAVRKSLESNKPIFIFAYTDWCGYCKKFKSHTLADSSVRQYMRDNFVNLQINMESEDGIRIARKYLISAYPTLLFLQPNAEELTKVTGYQDVASFMVTLKNAQDKNNSSGS